MDTNVSGAYARVVTNNVVADANNNNNVGGAAGGGVLPEGNNQPLLNADLLAAQQAGLVPCNKNKGRDIPTNFEQNAEYVFF